MTAYTVVDVVSDTREWELERRNSIGASDVPNVLMLPGAWGTPLEVYLSKKGVDGDFDEDMAFFGHALESTMQDWLEWRHPEFGVILPGFMARSTEHPTIHASFDRMTEDGIPIQMKTVSFFAPHDWANGCPLNVQAQVQTEIFVAGTDYAWVVAFIAGSVKCILKRIDRDQGFIDAMIPRVERFWTDHVQANRPPMPVTPKEATIVWQSNGHPLIVTDPSLTERLTDLHEMWGTWEQELTAITTQRDGAKLELQKVMQEFDEIVTNGRTLFSWRADTNGVRRFVRHKGGSSA